MRFLMRFKIIILSLLLLTQLSVEENSFASSPSGYNGLHGYISFGSGSVPSGYNMGMGFYAAVWPLVSKPLSNFQIGLPSAWISPDNRDNYDTPLCPVGTLARDNWPERGPTWRDVFQTVEGGLGYWAGNRFRYGPPKFSMNGTPQCYDYQVASPGWSFFGSSSPLDDDRLGIAQLSNRLLIPPDGLTFDGEPNGELLGYSWMALPLTEARSGSIPTGDQSWTCFLNASNFKGPIAYYVAETWSKIADIFNYPFDYGRGLDTKPGVMGGGAMEINTVPYFKATDSTGTVYTKIPQLQFPVDSQGQSYLVSDVTYYSSSALYDAVEAWREGGSTVSGKFADAGKYRSTLYTYSTSYDQEGITLAGINDVVNTQIYDSYTWGLKWSGSPGEFPQYFKQVGSYRVAVSEAEVPDETGLKGMTFPEANSGAAYAASMTGAWTQPGPASDDCYAYLADGTKITYRWYRFVDQPVFQQYNWSTQEKEQLQELVENIHTYWGINQEYMAPPGRGSLAALDSGLIVTPPAAYAVGYVPIVIRQEYAPEEDDYCESKSSNSDYFHIQQVQVGSFSNSSGAAAYSDFTSKIISMTIGETYSITLTPGYTQGAYTVGFRVWIDLNKDNDFDDSGEMVFEETNNGAVSSSITIPGTIAPGTTRMRISMKYNSYAGQCETINYGEVEDYTVTLSESSGGSCSAPTVSVSGTTENSIFLSWDDEGANSYSVYYKTTGTSSWTSAASGLTTTSYVITGLADNTTYDIAVQCVCPDGTQPYTMITAATEDSGGSGLTINDIPGQYVREPAANGWHTGTITLAGNSLQWTNEAGSAWSLIAALDEEKLLVGEDCPYYQSNGDVAFTLVLSDNSNGTVEVEGFEFLNEVYVRQQEEVDGMSAGWLFNYNLLDSSGDNDLTSGNNPVFSTDSAEGSYSVEFNGVDDYLYTNSGQSF
ncbi:MAG: fibronectin type III domain-containing protein, partial [bacterium]|nr:fibronectin type III domain-containing protein [bacterium]